MSHSVAGIDENGLGPKLGPLVVTGARFALAGAYDPQAFRRAFAGGATGAGARVADSKEVMAAGAMAAGETTVLALARLVSGETPPSADAFLARFAEGAPGDCPPGARALCFGDDLALPAFGGDGAGAAALADALGARLEAEGIRLASVRSQWLCPARFNAAFDGGAATKADLDLAAFEHRIEAFAAETEGEGLYLCGKVMNLAFYSARMTLPARFPLLRRQEARAESAYALQGLGTVRFLLDGDRIHPPISVASMFGKYVRELFMARLNRFFAARLPGHVPVSGYGDPVTRAFLRRAPALLAAEGIPADCFLRMR